MFTESQRSPDTGQIVLQQDAYGVPKLQLERDDKRISS
jgi:hypothetical protein